MVSPLDLRLLGLPRVGVRVVAGKKSAVAVLWKNPDHDRVARLQGDARSGVGLVLSYKEVGDMQVIRVGMSWSVMIAVVTLEIHQRLQAIVLQLKWFLQMAQKYGR